MPSDCSIEELLIRLRQAVQWCEPRADPLYPATSLRTLLGGDPFMPEPRKELVESVVRDRAYRLSHSHGAATPEDSNRSVVDGALVTPGRGRLLVFFPDVNLYHGLESDESRGYISVNNNPPQDTWLAYYDELPGQREFGSCLLSWVPRVFVASVDAAINVSPERCIEWLENLPCTLADEVRARSSRA